MPKSYSFEGGKPQLVESKLELDESIFYNEIIKTLLVRKMKVI